MSRLQSTWRALGLTGLLLVTVCTSAQEPVKPTDAGTFGGQLGSQLGGMFSNVVSTLKGKSELKPLFASLVAEPYKPSNEAIGLERDVESKRVNALGLVPIKPLQAHLNAILQRLKDGSGVSAVPGQVYLLATSDMDAHSSPDGNIFLSVNWVENAGSEDELAALLAHELSHVLLHHHDSTAFSRAQKQLQGWFTVGSVLKNGLDKAQQAGVKVPLSPGQDQAIRRMSTLIALTDKAILPAFARTDEVEADKLAADLMRKAGFSLKGVLDFIDRIAEWDERQQAIRRADDAALQQNMLALVSGGEFDAALKGSLDNALTQFIAGVSSAHEDGASRREQLQTYIDKIHAEAPREAVKREAYRTLLADKSVKPLLDGYRQAFSAETALRAGRQDEAIRLMAPLTRPNAALAQHAMPLFQMYLALRESGQRDEANRYLDRSFQAQEPAWRPFAEAIRQRAREGKKDQAIALAKDASKRFQDAPALLPQMVGLWAEVGYKDKMDEVLLVCKLVQVNYRDDCQARSKKS